MMPFTIDDLNPAEERLVWDLYLKSTTRAASNALPRPNQALFLPRSGRTLPDIDIDISFLCEGRDETAARAEPKELK